MLKVGLSIMAVTYALKQSVGNSQATTQKVKMHTVVLFITKKAQK